MITNNNYNVNLASLSEMKLMFEFAKQMNFDVRSQGRKSTRDRTLIILLKPPANMASGISTAFLPCDPDELCDRLKLLLQEKQAGENSNTINDEIVAIVDKTLKHKSMSKKEHEQTSIKCNLLQ